MTLDHEHDRPDGSAFSVPDLFIAVVTINYR
jgi:hypothetical protein